MHRVVALAVLVTVAGCSGFAADRDQPGTLTPAPVPTTAPGPSPTPASGPTVAPGVTRDGIESPATLADAHMTIRTATGYTVRVNQTIRYLNGTLRTRRTKVTRVASQGVRFHRHIEVEGRTAAPPVRSPPGNVKQWSNGIWLFSQVTTAGNTTYRTLMPDQYAQLGEYYRPLPHRDALIRRLSAAAWRVDVAVTREGPTHYRVSATQLSHPDRFALAERAIDPRNLTMWLRVDPDGHIPAMFVEYEAELGGEPVRVTRTVQYTDRGTTSVERPDWVDYAHRGAQTREDAPNRDLNPASSRAVQ